MTAPNDPQKTPLDLSDLQSLNFGPSWATSSTPRAPSAPRESRDYGDRRDSRGDGRGFGGGDRRPDRRGFGGGAPRQGGRGDGFGQNRQPSGDRRQDGGRRFGDERPPRRDSNFDRREPRNPRFQRDFENAPPRGRRFGPAVEVAFFPEDKPFSVLAKAVRSSLRTFELFEIAQLILEKNDRLLVGCRPLDSETNKEARLYQSVPDQLPFLSEADAVAHVMSKHLERFFTVETVEVEPPKGNFLMVSKCGFTGEILGPPNYHGYQQTLREHHAARLPRVPFEKFTSRIESTRDPELVNQWLERMKQLTRYTLKDRKEGDPETFDSLDAARNFLIAHRKNQLVRAHDHLRFPGRMIASMPIGPLRDTIERELAYQRQFPLMTANNIRARLKKMGLNLFKRRSKGITLVSAVHPKHRTPQTVFTDGIQRVVDFVEKNPDVKITDLPEKMLGIAPVLVTPEPSPAPVAEASPVTEPSPEAPVSAEAEATSPSPETAQAEATETTETPAEIPAEVADETQAEKTEVAETPVTDEAPAAEISSSEPTPTEEPSPAPEAAPAAEKTEVIEKASPAETPAAAEPVATVDLSNPAIRELLNTVRWLVSEGYVTEYSDGRLFAAPALTEAQVKAAADQIARARQGKKGDAASADKKENKSAAQEKEVTVEETSTEEEISSPEEPSSEPTSPEPSPVAEEEVTAVAEEPSPAAEPEPEAV